MKSILFSTAAGWLARVLAIVVNFGGMPVVLQTLGPTRFGIMLMAISVGSWAGFGNLGFGSAVGLIVARFFHRSKTFVPRVVSCVMLMAIVCQSVFFLISSAVLLLMSSRVNLGPDDLLYRHDFVISALIMILASNLQLFLSVFDGVDAGQHQLYRLYRYQIVAYGLVLLLLLTVFPAMPSIAFATTLLGAGFLAGNLMHAADVWKRHSDLFTAGVAGIRRRLVKALILSSADFTIISLATSVIFQFTTGLVGLIVGPDEIINLGVFMRIHTSTAGVILTVTVPMANLIVARVAKQDLQGAVDAALLTGAGLLSICGVAALGFDLLGERLISIWLRTPTQFDPGFRMMASCLIFTTAFSLYATGIGIGFGNLRRVARIHAIEACAVLPLAYVCYLFFGQAGILGAMNAVLFAGAAASIAARPLAANLRQRLGAGYIFARRAVLR
jgi:O-antigen/teichoic acid export membrane protein